MSAPVPDLVVRRVGPEHWASHRDLRLEMLTAAPDAFWTTLGEVAGRDEARWREEIAGERIHLQALSRGEVVGGLGIDPVGYDEDMLLDADTVNVVAVYVRPAHRGGAVVRALMAAAAQHVRGLGRHRMLLETTSDNAAARRRYESLGFTPTGRTAPDPRRAAFCEIEYAARLEDLRLG